MKKSFSGLNLHFGFALNIFLALALVFLLIPHISSSVQANSIPPFSSPQIQGNAGPPVEEEKNGENQEQEKEQRQPIETKQIVEPDKDTQIRSGNGNISLHISGGTLEKSAEFTIKQHVYGGSAGMQMVNVFELTAEESQSKSQLNRFKKELQLTIQHTPAELAGLDIDSLGLYYLDEKTNEWVPVASALDKETLTLTANINHFSYYGENANPLQSGPGKVNAAQVNLHSGAAMYSYPIELPPGPGGFQPSLNLSYNSSSVDEMKNKRDVGSWVGIGWDMSIGSITYDLVDRSYSLNINGVSHSLVNLSATEYKTNPESNYKINRSGNVWVVKDCEGTSFRFGGTTDSEQYLTNNIYYRWDLSYWEDTNANSATVTYDQDFWNGGVRAAYPASLTYNTIQVIFDNDWDREDATDGKTRYDNPLTTAANPAPKIMETRRLDSIRIYAASNLIKKYDLEYATIGCGDPSTDYGGIYYAGKHTLTAISQYGSDGITTLPQTTFTYETKDVYRMTSETQYTGNPGNPAALPWPFLVTIDSGYGGDISFTYSQKPALPVYDIWTRQIVTVKTIDSGNGPVETYTYTYSGNPIYYGTGWNQSYRGFPMVTETDSAGNYTEHYFFTTGTVEGKSADHLTGKEYKTKWYQAGNPSVLLKETNYDWEWTETENQTEGTYIGCQTGGNISNARGIAISPDGYVYITSYNTNRILKYSSELEFVSSPFDNIPISYPNKIAISEDGYIFVVSNSSYIDKYDQSGNLLGTLNYNQYTISDIVVSGCGLQGGTLYVSYGELHRVFTSIPTSPIEEFTVTTQRPITL